MSGGSYNYLYCKDVYFDGWGDIHEMIDRLKELGYKKAAKDTQKVCDLINKAQDLMDRLCEVHKAVEWYDSNDWGIDDLKDAIKKYNNL